MLLSEVVVSREASKVIKGYSLNGSFSSKNKQRSLFIWEQTFNISLSCADSQFETLNCLSALAVTASGEVSG